MSVTYGVLKFWGLWPRVESMKLPNSNFSQDTLHHVMSNVCVIVSCVLMYVCLCCLCSGSVFVRGFGSSSNSLGGLPPAFLCHTRPPIEARRCLWCIEIHEAAARLG